jgi:hypothetical protein
MTWNKKSIGSQFFATYTTPGLLCAPGVGNLETLERSYGGILSIGIVIPFYSCGQTGCCLLSCLGRKRTASDPRGEDETPEPLTALMRAEGIGARLNARSGGPGMSVRSLTTWMRRPSFNAIRGGVFSASKESTRTFNPHDQRSLGTTLQICRVVRDQAVGRPRYSWRLTFVGLTLRLRGVVPIAPFTKSKRRMN